MRLTSEVKAPKNGRCIGIHSEHKKGIKEQTRTRKVPKEYTKLNSAIKRLTLVLGNAIYFQQSILSMLL